MASLLDGMTKEQKLKFLYIDLISRNLVDEETAKKDFKKALKNLKKKRAQSQKIKRIW